MRKEMFVAYVYIRVAFSFVQVHLYLLINGVGAGVRG